MDRPCPSCGHRNEAGAPGCSSCGAPLSPQDVTSEIGVFDGDAQGGNDAGRSSFGPGAGLFLVLQGPKAGARYALDDDLVTVGRHPKSTIFLDDVTVSRRHAEVHRRGSVYRVLDAGSLNGTYVNRSRVDDAELDDDDEIQIGRFKLVFVRGTGR